MVEVKPRVGVLNIAEYTLDGVAIEDLPPAAQLMLRKFALDLEFHMKCSLNRHVDQALEGRGVPQDVLDFYTKKEK